MIKIQFRSNWILFKTNYWML